MKYKIADARWQMVNSCRPYFLTIVLISLTCCLYAQSKYNFSQINYNTLLINPAYAGNTGATSFQASYRGIIGGAGTGAPRRFDFTLHAPLSSNDKIGIGGVFDIYRISTITNLSLQPSFAYQIELSDNQRLAIGGQFRFSYFDFGRNNTQTGFDLPRDLLTGSFGLGVYYYKDNFFAGLSATNIGQFELNQADENYPSILGEHPIYLHSGFWFQALDLMKIKVAGLVNRTTFFEYPTQAQRSLDTKFEVAGNINAIFDDRYWFGMSYGRVNNDEGTADYTYINFSAVYTFNLARASYTYQQLLNDQFNTAANTTHVILLEFDIINGGEDRVIRYY